MRTDLQGKVWSNAIADDCSAAPPAELTASDRRARRIGVLLGAEAYQAHHVADIAWELAARPGVEVEILAVLPEFLAEISHLAGLVKARSVPRRLLHTSAALRAAQRLRVFGSLKTAVMRHPQNLHLLSSYDAIVTPTDHVRFVRQRLKPRPELIYVSHGIGGRAASYSSKYEDFDFVVLASRNDERRLLADGRIAKGRYAVAGYPKLETHPRRASKSPPVRQRAAGGTLQSAFEAGVALSRSDLPDRSSDILRAPATSIWWSLRTSSCSAGDQDSSGADGNAWRSRIGSSSISVPLGRTT